MSQTIFPSECAADTAGDIDIAYAMQYIIWHIVDAAPLSDEALKVLRRAWASLGKQLPDWPDSRAARNAYFK